MLYKIRVSLLTNRLFRLAALICILSGLGLLLSAAAEASRQQSPGSLRQNFPAWLLLESAREEGAWLQLSNTTPGVLSYSGGMLPDKLDLPQKMYTFKASFRLPEEARQADLSLYAGLFEYPFRIYLNGHELLKKGRYQDGHYNSSLRLSTQVYLSPDLLEYSADNELVVEIYPAFETWALDAIWIDTTDKVAAAVFLRSFLGVELLKVACVLSFAICLYFLVLNFTIPGQTRQYLYFAIFCLMFGVTYLNVVIYHEAINELFFEALSKAGMVILTTALLFFIRNFTWLLPKAKVLWGGILLASTAAGLLIFLQDGKEGLLASFGTALNLLILPQLLFIIVLLLIYKIRHKGQYFWPLFLALLVLAGCVAHDAYYFLGMTLPYVWLTTYGFFGLVVGIFAILVAEQTRIYNMTVQQATALQAKQQQIENLNSELTLQKNSFFRFVPTEFLQLLGKDSAVDIQLGDSSLRYLTVMFSDIRRFASLCEGMRPDKNFEFLNDYLNLMEKAIYLNHGFIDKYIGDAIMALFAVKDDTESCGADTALRSCSKSADISLTAALEMEHSLTAFNQQLQLNGLEAVSIGIGINTGPAVLGTVGSITRLDTTVIGDSVNIASRLESLTKMYRTTTLVSEYTMQALVQPENFSLRLVDTVVLAGRSAPMKVYELLDTRHEDGRQRFAAATLLAEGMELYRRKNFDQAAKVFRSIEAANPADSVAQLYSSRCQSITAGPIDPAWDGIFRPHK